MAPRLDGRGQGSPLFAVFVGRWGWGAQCTGDWSPPSAPGSLAVLSWACQGQGFGYSRAVEIDPGFIFGAQILGSGLAPYELR